MSIMSDKLDVVAQMKRARAMIMKYPQVLSVVVWYV